MPDFRKLQARASAKLKCSHSQPGAASIGRSTGSSRADPSASKRNAEISPGKGFASGSVASLDCVVGTNCKRENLAAKDPAPAAKNRTVTLL